MNRHSLMAAAVTAAFASAGFAQSVPNEKKDADTQPATKLDKVLVTDQAPAPNAKLPLDTPAATGSRLGLTPRQTAATINIVDRETMDSRGTRDTLEALQGVPGVTADSPPGGGGSVSMRGFSSSQVTQMFNGIDVGYVIAAHPVDSWILDRVEVLGGASSFLYGQGAVGGAVNYVSKLATRSPSPHDAMLRGGSHGAWQAAYGGQVALGGPDARHFVRVDASVQGWDGYVKRTDGRSQVLAASWLADLTPRLAHTLAWEWQNKAHQPYWGTPLLNPTAEARFDPALRFTNFNTGDGAYEQVTDWVRSILEFRLSDRTRLTHTAYFYDAERDYRNVETYRYTADNARVQRTGILAQKHGQTLMGDKLELAHQGTLAGLSSDWSFGLDMSRNKQTRYPTSLSTTVSTVNPYDFTLENFFDIPGVTPATNPDRDNRVFIQALYAENITRLGGGWSVLSGLRAEKIRIDAVNYRAVNAANPAYFQRDYSPVTGRIGAMWEFARHANVYATYSTAADPPSGILTTINFGAIQDFDLTKGNQLEVGSKFDFLDGRGNGTVAAYRIQRKNLSMPDPDNPNVSIPVGAQSSRGLEAQAGVRLNAAWRLQANVAYVKARFDRFVQVVGGVAVDRAGNRPTGIPERVANLYANWDFLPGWSAYGGVRYVSDRWGNVDNTQRFASYTLLDAGLAWKLSPRASLVVRGRNLADEVYVASGSSQVRLGEPRAWEIALRTTF
jgi:iron complex outermembrane receptor protein